MNLTFFAFLAIPLVTCFGNIWEDASRIRNELTNFGNANVFVSTEFSMTDSFTVEDDVISLITHPSSEFDKKYYIQQGVDVITKFSNLHQIPSILISHREQSTKSYNKGANFVPRDDVKLGYFSENGDFTFQLSSTTIFMAGGHLEFCFCRTLRSVLKNNLFIKNEINLVLVSDAIYGWRELSANFTSDKFSYFSDLEPYKSLQMDLEVLNEEQLTKFIAWVFETDRMRCHFEGSSESGPIDISQYQLNLIIDGKEFGTISSGQKKVNIHFVKSENLDTFYKTNLKI